MTQTPNINNPIRVMISDDHPVVRQGLRMMLEAYSDLLVVAEAEDGEQTVHLAAEIKPDVLVIDLLLPVKDGITAIQEITKDNPEARILVLTSFSEDEMLIRAVKAGAAGYHLKDSAPEQLVESIRTVHRGEAALHPIVAKKLMQEIKRIQETHQEGELLTPRELDVLKCLAQGLSNQDIAAKLTVSVRTVTTHIRNILDKLHLANRTQAALYAVERGIYTKP